MKKEFSEATVLIKQQKRGVEPVIFVIENDEVYIIGITPDGRFDVTDEGKVGERWDANGDWCGSDSNQ